MEPPRRWSPALVLLLVLPAARADDPPPLRWGTDPTGGAPYVYKPKGGADAYVGFEVELAEYLAKKLGRTSRMVDGTWKTLPELLDKPRDGDKGIDIVLNGYELRPDLASKYDGNWHGWILDQDARTVAPRKPGGDQLNPIEEAPGSFVRVRV